MMIQKRLFFSFFKQSTGPKVVFKVYPEGEYSYIQDITGIEGENLQDTLNKARISDLNDFGICGKKGRCESCRVNVKKGYSQFPPIKKDEKNGLYRLKVKRLYFRGSTRMSCYIQITKEIEGTVIELPRSAFL